MIHALVALFGLAQSHLESGKAAFDKHRYREAVKAFEQARAHDCHANFFLGLSRYRLGESDEAARDFQAATQCDAKFAPARVALAEIHVQRGDNTRATEAFEAALLIDGRNVDALRGVSRIYLDAQQNDKAIPVLETLAAAVPDDADVASQLGAAYGATNNFGPAEQHFKSALQLKPSHASAMTGLANVLLKTERIPEAVALLHKAALTANAYEPLFLLGSAYNSGGESKKAVDALQQAVKLSPNEPEAWYQLATAFGKLGSKTEQQQALRQFKLVKERGQKHQQAKVATAEAIRTAGQLIEQGSLRQAADKLERALTNDGSNADLQFRTAAVHYDLKDFNRARQLVQEAIHNSPSEWRYEHLRGLIEKSDNKPIQAKQALEAASRLNPSEPEIHNQLGDLELRSGNPQSAVNHFNKAVKLAPNDPSYRLNLEAAQAAFKAK